MAAEAALFQGYSRSQELDVSRIEARPCVCGGLVRADPAAPAKGVAQHNASPRHRAWRGNREGEG